MPQSIFIFDFGTNEDAAQAARHKVDAWRQGFRLGNKMLLKFERAEASGDGAPDSKPASRQASQGKTAGKKTARKQEEAEGPKAAGNVRMFVRLDFSDHEKLSHQRWVDRLPNEEPFKAAKPQMVRIGDPDFPKTAELFDALD